MKSKYGKSMLPLLNIKEDFFANNAELLKINLKLAKVYSAQEERLYCKVCDEKLIGESDFNKQGVEYILCNNCGHLNGRNEDTEEFANAVYVDEVTDYSSTYYESNRIAWENRKEKIYLAKAEFLKGILEDDVENINILDVGAGSGYFIGALENVGITKVQGIEVSLKQTDLGNAMLGENKIKNIELSALSKEIEDTKCNVISFIGVLEHLTNPKEVLQKAMKNKNIQYIYLSVPMFSYSVFLEINSQSIFNRHLSGGHTHLYTNESLKYIESELQLERLAEWRFGVDAMDFYRQELIKLRENKVSERLISLFKKEYMQCLDQIQLILDQSQFSSEIHLIWSKKK